MKATGIIRCIDALGRVVIPSEIRRTLGAPEGTPMEFWVDGKNIVLKKYQPIIGPSEIAGDLFAAIENSNVENQAELLAKVKEVQRLLQE